MFRRKATRIELGSEDVEEYLEAKQASASPEQNAEDRRIPKCSGPESKNQAQT